MAVKADLRYVERDGTHLVLADDDGNQYRLPVDDALRAALRPDDAPEPVAPAGAPSGGAAEATEPSTPAAPKRTEPDPNIRPRDVQAFLRSGMSAQEVADRTGWTVDKVRRFEPPIVAERGHVATIAQNSAAPTRAGGQQQTIGDRVTERLEQRGVISADVEWDAWRTERGWTIVARFAAGGRQRTATWRYDAATRSVHPHDDEARWLTEEDGVTNTPLGSGRATPDVYDVVAEGGLEAQRRPRRSSTPAQRLSERVPYAEPDPQEPEEVEDADGADESKDGKKDASAEQDSPVDLVSVMRARSKSRRTGRKSAPKKADQPEKKAPAETTDLGHDPVTGTADLFGLDDMEAPQADSDDTSTDSESSPSTHRPAGAEGRTASSSSAQDAEDTDDASTDHAGDGDATASASSDEDDAPQQKQSVPERPSATRKGRPSVPSWDDIMFGKRSRD